MRILLVEDEIKLVRPLTLGLSKRRHAVDTLENGEVALKRIIMNQNEYDLIILDLMLPGLNGAEVCRLAREANVTMPVLILTARTETEQKVKLLSECGADDYLVKPFSFEELYARIEALTRRPQAMLPTTLKAGDIELNPASRTVEKGGVSISLTLKEFALLEYFMRNPGRVLNREEIISNVWDYYFNGFSNVVDVYIKNLRKKLESPKEPRVIETVRGIGYKLAEM
jgi:DNA-binding response OmpR family regulator